MLDTVKSYIQELPELTFGEFYQDYICRVQDMNIRAEIDSSEDTTIMSLRKLVARLNAELGKR